MLSMFWLVDCGRRRRVFVPLGWQPLALWLIFVLLGILNGNDTGRQLGYAAWLVIDVVTVCVVVWLVSCRYVSLLRISRYYYISFFVVAVIGIIQFVAGVFFGADLYVTEWWIRGVLPRVNALTYEPSYLATYLIPGWVMAEFFVVERAWAIVPKRIAWCGFYVVTIAMVLSSSRMGVAVMVLWLVGDVVRRFVMENYRYQSRSAFVILLLTFSLLAMTLVGVGVGGRVELHTLLAGLGIHGSSAHSVEDRLGSARDVMRVIKRYPVVGVSLGGVAPAIAETRGIRARGYEETKEFEGQNVFLEVIAGSGWIGSIPFFLFLLIIVGCSLRLRSHSEVEVLIVRALIYGLIMQFVILQFNQNVLRPYVWIHVAMVCACCNAVMGTNGTRIHALVC